MDLASILNPVSKDAFLDRYFSREFVRIPGSPEKFAGVAGSFETLAQTLERDLEAPIHIAELESSGARARDTLFLQIEGESECKVHNAGDHPVWSGRLKQGDTVYVPRDWMAWTTPRGILAAFDIENPTGADLLAWVVEYVKKHEAFQKDLPRYADPAEKAEYAAHLRRVLAGVFRAPGLFELHRRARMFRAQTTSRPAQPADRPWTPDAPIDLMIALATPRKFRLKRGDGDEILLTSARKRLAFPREAAAMLQFLADRAPVAIAEFQKTFGGEFDREELSDFLSALSRDGIIRLRPPD